MTPFYWQKRERSDGSYGTAHHAFPMPHPIRGPWRPLCGSGQHPPNWTLHLPATAVGEPMPEGVPICKVCKDKALGRTA